MGVAFCGFLLKAPHGHPFWFSGNQGHSILPSYWPPAVISDIPQSTALPSTAFPPSYRTFSPRLCCLRRRMAILSGSLGTRGTASCHPIGLLPSYRTFHSPRLCHPRPFLRHTGLSVHGFAVDGLSAVILDFPQSTALPSTALPPSYRTYSPRPFCCHTRLHYSLRLCRPRPFWAFCSSPLS